MKLRYSPHFPIATMIAWLIVATICLPSRGRAEPVAIEPPTGGSELLSFNEASPIDFQSQEIDATAAWTPIDGMPFSQLYRVKSDTRFSDPENARVTVPISGEINKGDVVLISFWMRRPGAGGQPNNASFTVESKSGEVGVEAGYEYKLSAYREWKQHVRSFVAPFDYVGPSRAVRIDLGEAGKTADIADLRLINYGPDRDIDTLPRSTVNYPGRAADAAWREAAQERIERIRKGDIAIEVIDNQGKPVANARVTVAMLQHAFGFGNAVNSEILGAPKSDFPIRVKGKAISWEDAQRYREVVAKYFDRVTFASELRPHNWKRLSSGEPGWDRKYRILMARTFPWLREQGIAARGHYIGWAPMDFNAIEKQFVGKPEEHRAWLWAHMADVLPATEGLVAEWDTINHIVGWGKHTYEKEYGGPEIYAEILAEARRLAPNATHAINEGKVLPDGYKREPYLKVIRELNEQGQAPDLVGFMAHFGLTTLTPPEELLEVYDEFAKVAPRLQLSEFDVEAGDDEALQADYFRDAMIATFSHPNFEAIVQWGFWEKIHWKPAAALWSTDWKLKPAGKVFVDLVAHQWWTDETLSTDSAGRCELRGFLGEYQITVEQGGRTQQVAVTLDSDGASLQIRLP